MTAQIIPLHTEVAAAPAAQSPTSPTQDEKKVIAAYVKVLKARGWCKMDTEGAKETRLFNRFNRQIRYFPYIRNNFDDWLEETSNECEFYNERYFTKGLVHTIGQVFDPRTPKDYVVDSLTACRYANTYQRYVPQTNSADVSPLLHEFFERLFPLEHERKIVLQWLAHMFQHPEKRPSWHLMFTSQPGLGKGFLVQDILHPILNHTAVIYKFDQLLGKFSAVITDNLLILMDDCKSKSDSTQTQLKSLLSEERAYVERKFAGGNMENTYARFILASNEDKPLHLDDPNERRWFVPTPLKHRKDKHETQAFIARLDAWLKEEGSLCRVYNWFMQYPLDGFNHKDVPDSEGLRAIIGMSQNPYKQYLEDYVKDNTVFTYADLVEAITADRLSKPSDRELGHLLREVGYEATQRRIDGQRLRLCHPTGMSLQDIRAAYGADSQPEPNKPPF